MSEKLTETYAKIRKIVESEKIGIPQVCVISVNTVLTGEEFERKRQQELLLMSDVFKSNVDKERVCSLNKPYVYGFVAREYKNGSIGRYTYTSAPIAENTQITVYGTDGELRFNSETAKIVIYPQVPDHVGEEYKE